MIVYVIQKIGGNENPTKSINVMLNCHYHGKNKVITRKLPSMVEGVEEVSVVF